MCFSVEYMQCKPLFFSDIWHILQDLINNMFWGQSNSARFFIQKYFMNKMLIKIKYLFNNDWEYYRNTKGILSLV